MDRKFIFIHNPKTAGTTLRNSIESIFGKENMLLDYNRPMKDITIVRNSKNIISSFSTKQLKEKIIFGHTLPCKYCDFRLDGFHKRKDHIYLTFLREPLQRTISLYYFFQRDPISPNAVPLRVKLTKEKWSLETFLTYPGLWQNFYAKYFFGFSIEKFDFVGITENYSSSIRTLSKMYEELSKIQIFEANVNTEKTINQFYEIDKNLEIRFRKLNKKDYEIYEQAKIINQKLIKKYDV